jgi:GlpG protein
MPEYKVVDTAIDEDLSDFSRFLWQKGVSHRLVREGDRQLLLVGHERDALRVAGAYRSLKAGQLQWSEEEPSREHVVEPSPSLLAFFPVTLLCALLSIIGYFIVALDADYGLVKYLTFFQFDRVGQHIMFSLPQGEYWRLITPIFLHFGVMHIVFNTLWLWDLGRRIELLQGSMRMLGIVLVIGLGSNIAQFVYADVGIFGGMSGVIYGLLGYGWVWSSLMPQYSLHIPKAVIIFMLVWLVLCFAGFASLMGLGDVANAAHLGGLIMGMLMGLGAALIARVSGKA